MSSLRTTSGATTGSPVTTVSGAGDGSLNQLATGIGYATAASGVGLAVLPSLVLRLLGAGRAQPAPFLFRIVGMFMMVSGGQLAEAARAGESGKVARRWAMAAKVGAAVMVTVGVLTGRFKKRALALAAFDAFAAVLLTQLTQPTQPTQLTQSTDPTQLTQSAPPSPPGGEERGHGPG